MNLPISLYVALRYWRAKAPIVLGDLLLIWQALASYWVDGIDYCAFCHEWIRRLSKTAGAFEHSACDC